MTTETIQQYRAKYTDARGSEETIILNDGDTLRMTLRGVEFTSKWLDDWKPTPATSPELLAQFSFDCGELRGGEIECEIAMPIHDNGARRDSVLGLRIVLEGPNNPENYTLVYATLKYAGELYSSSGWSGGCEDELLQIQKQLPDGIYMLACINCLYSDYTSMGGSNFFGEMYCFRELKEDYLKVTTKGEYYPVLSRCRILVQETHLCPEFTRRIPGTGYRG